MNKDGAVLDVDKPQEVSYCVDLWLRDEQIRLNLANVPGRVKPGELKAEPMAVVCYGPSLADTWEQIKKFVPYVLSCSGAHKFLIERGIVPMYHCDVDPRAHKIALMGEPHKEVEYLLAATCHPKYCKLLVDGGYNVKLWHVYDGQDQAMRTVPAGEWALTGGCSVGLRALSLARFLGFRDLHVFGMDGSDGKTGKHAGFHPNQPKVRNITHYKGVEYGTTPAMLEAARQTFHELDQLKDVKATFYGDGLVQAMAKDYVPNPSKSPEFIAFNKPEMMSAEYLRLNQQLHEDNLAYGVGGGKHADTVKKLVSTLKADGVPAVLDYGCGKSYLQKNLDFPIWQYDPAVPAFSESPRPADLVVCTDVLEHVEPDRLDFVLGDLRRCVKQLGYLVVHTGPARKTLPDGRNTHLIQQGEAWWRKQLGRFFDVATVKVQGPELHILVSPLTKKPKQVQAISNPIGLTFARFTPRRDPYWIGVAKDILDGKIYTELAATFPDLSLFKKFGGGDEKFSLSERNNPDAYHQFIASTPVWKTAYDYLKSREFIEKILRVLKAHKAPVSVTADELRPRFEFSILPANGGLLRPHTDLASKVATLVISMKRSDEAWYYSWGGGTDVFALVDPTEKYADYMAPAHALDNVHTYQYEVNQGVLFVKTDNSWHGVGPIEGPEGYLRKTITINLERMA